MTRTTPRRSSYTLATLPALVVLGFFVWFANWIPQTRWEPPKVREVNAEMSPADLAEIGKAIVRERGCLACHTIEPGAGVKGQGRGPNLANIAPRRAEGVAGGPGNLVDYLAEALYAPDAYLVKGYANIMPAATKPPAKLTYEEATAVVAFLQSLGARPTVRVGDLPRPRAQGAAAPEAQASAVRVATAPAAAAPREILDASGCLGCHGLEPGEVLVGPPLDAARLREAAAARGMSPELYLMESIVDPRAVEPDEFPQETMPDTYGEDLSAAQLHTLTRFLLGKEAAR